MYPSIPERFRFAVWTDISDSLKELLGKVIKQRCLCYERKERNQGVAVFSEKKIDRKVDNVSR